MKSLMWLAILLPMTGWTQIARETDVVTSSEARKFQRWDNNGGRCRPLTLTGDCMEYLIAAQCDAEVLGTESSWKRLETRTKEWQTCAVRISQEVLGRHLANQALREQREHEIDVAEAAKPEINVDVDVDVND